MLYIHFFSSIFFSCSRCFFVINKKTLKLLFLFLVYLIKKNENFLFAFYSFLKHIISLYYSFIYFILFLSLLLYVIKKHGQYYIILLSHFCLFKFNSIKLENKEITNTNRYLFSFIYTIVIIIFKCNKNLSKFDRYII